MMTPAILKMMKADYPGRRIQFVAFGEPDPFPLTPGLEGTIVHVDDGGTVHVEWDNGRTLGLAWGDKYVIR